MRNIEDKSNSWDQSVLHRLMTTPSRLLSSIVPYILFAEGKTAKVSKELSQTVLAKTTRDPA